MSPTTKSSSIFVAAPSMNSPNRRRRMVAEAAFAGRLGGNQEFIANVDDGDAQSLLAKQPDAAPLTSIVAAVNFKGILEPDLWRMAVIEGWGTFLLIMVVGAASSALTQLDQSAFAVTLYAALVGTMALALFTYCLAPVSGAHINPAITMATFFAGLSSLPRTILYITAQSIGAIIGGYWLRLGLGNAYFPAGVIPGCTVDPLLVSPGQLFVLEYTFCHALIFLAFGLGLDPRQGKALSPSFAPLLIGLVLGLGTLCSGLARPGYTGMSFNPARCLGLMAARNRMQWHYLHWLASLTAAMVNGLFYHFVPPWATERVAPGQNLRESNV